LLAELVNENESEECSKRKNGWLILPVFQQSAPISIQKIGIGSPDQVLAGFREVEDNLENPAYSFANNCSGETFSDHEGQLQQEKFHFWI
jgi:hypothetical protein